jgi:hypothetical protein
LPFEGLTSGEGRASLLEAVGAAGAACNRDATEEKWELWRRRRFMAYRLDGRGAPDKDRTNRRKVSRAQELQDMAGE